MWGEPKQATSATTSLIYITIGALVAVWSVVYYFDLRNNNGTDTAFLWVYGFMASGVVLFLIGLAVGWIGRTARPAEVAAIPTPQVVAPTVAATPVQAVADPDDNLVVAPSPVSVVESDRHVVPMA